MEPNTLIYALNEFIVIYRKILQNYTHYRYNFYNNFIFSIFKFRGVVVSQPYLCKKIPYLVCYSVIWLLGTVVNSSCDIKINSQNCCIKSAVKELRRNDKVIW